MWPLRGPCSPTRNNFLTPDEATSNLDTESESLIQKSLNALVKDRTTFVIAHRRAPSAKRRRSLVIQHGVILLSVVRTPS